MRPGARQLLAAVAACGLLAGCSDYATVKPVASHPASSLTLPPVGFDHQYGNDPLASRDGFALERQWFARTQFWEVYLGVAPAQVGYFKVGTPAVLRAARHQVTSVTLVLATEQQALMSGLLAYPTDAAQETWAQGLVTALAQQGYDGLRTARVYIYFTEAHLHSVLSYTAGGPTTYDVKDGDLKGSGLPFPGQVPLAPATLTLPG